MYRIILLSFLFILPAVCFAQSTLEYTSLLTAQGGAAAAGAGKKEKKENGEAGTAGQSSGLVGGAMKTIYADTSNTLMKSSSLLGQVGGGAGASAFVSPIKGIERTTADEDLGTNRVKNEASTDVVANTLVKVRLRSGQVIQGNLIERTGSHIKLEAAGVVVTYFAEEVASITPAYEMKREVP